MNTVKKGTDFELNSYNLIRKAIDAGQFGIIPNQAKTFQHKGYFSKLRESEIIFDLSIEVWPPTADRFTILYLIECKNYTTKDVPVGDVESFIYKVQQIANHGYFIKAAFISNSSFQKGALTIAENARLMLMEVSNQDELMIRLYKAEKQNNQNDDSKTQKIDEFELFLFNLFDTNKVQGVQRLNKEAIEKVASQLINEVDEIILKGCLRTPLTEVMNYLTKKYDLYFNFDEPLRLRNNILGVYSSEENTIYVDKGIRISNRFAFVLAHEIGHFLLHRHVKLNQQTYDLFEDSKYDFLANKHTLKNPKNWIEWQANQFAASLTVPKLSLLNRLIHIQAHLGISKRGFIYVDDQPINKKDFFEITNYLSSFFDTTKTNVIYQLEASGLMIYDPRLNSFNNELRSIYLSSTSNDIVF